MEKTSDETEVIEENKDNNKDNEDYELTEEDKDGIVKMYDDCVEYFEYIVKESENFWIIKEIYDEIFDMVKCKNMIFMYEGNKDIIDGVMFYCDIHEKVTNIKTFDELKKAIKYFFIDNKDSPHMETNYNLLAALMQINIHVLWQQCYELHPRFRNNPEDAMRDAIDPITCSQKIMKDIVDELNELENK
jgi:hypothetical protein